MTNKVLIVEDEGVTARNLARLLESEGFQVVDTPPTGREAIQVANQKELDLVVMDIRLADEMTGIDAAKQIYDTHQLPVIYLTAHTDEATVQEAKSTQPFGFLSKPVNKEDLVNTVEVVMEKKETISEEKQKLQTQVDLSKKRYDQLIRALPDIVYHLEPDGTIEFISDAVRQIGYEPEELVGDDFRDFLHQQDIENHTRQEVLPELKGEITGPEEAPKLFDERRRKQRRTEQLVVRIIPGDEDESIHYFEVTSAGIYQNEDDFIGTVGVMRDITERKIMEEELEQKNQKLKQKNRELERFADLATHDFKQPLRTIVSFADILDEECIDPSDETATDSLDKIRDSARHINELLQAIRSYMNLELGDSVKKTNLTELLDNVKSALEGIIQEKQATIIVGELPTVSVNPSLFRQVFQNLLENSIRYCDKQTPVIEIDSLEKENGWTIVVEDNGPGIPESRVDEAFEVFQSLEEESSGQGLGLALCEKVLLLHGGDIKATPIDQGTRIELNLPR